MKKTLLATSLAAAMSVATTADAAFTPMGAGDYSISITGGCFAFGNCQTQGTTDFQDLTAGQATFTTVAKTVTTRAVGSIIGSGSTTSGDFGTINFSLDAGGNITITSYAQTSYLGTAGGTFFVDALGSTGTGAMTGTIDGGGNVFFTPTGREGAAAAFMTGIGVQEWNNSKKIGMYDSFSTGTQTNVAKGASPAFSVTGSVLQDTGTANERSGIIASTGNINGDNWTGFNNVQFSEIFNVTVSLLKGLPNAVDDDLIAALNTPKIININDDLIKYKASLPGSDTHADVNETLSYDSFSTTDTGCITDTASSVTDNGNGTLTYVPNAAFTDPSTDCFTYTITDSQGTELSTAKVNLTVTGSLPPVANADDVSTPEDTQLILDPVDGSLGVSGVVPDTDPNPAEVLTISAFDDFSTQGGTITREVGTNNLTYVPAADYFGSDTFSYTIQNSVPLLSTTTVTINVTPVNDAPVCTDVSLTTPANTPLVFNEDDLVSTTTTPPICTDAEDNPVSLKGIEPTGSQQGTIASNGAGELTYAPATDYQGLETFSYIATDGITDSVPNTLTINVADPLASNFTMLEKAGNVFGGTNDVVIGWDETTFNTNADNGSGVPTDTDFSIITMSTKAPFFGFVWTAHHIRIFKNDTAEAITYSFDVTCLASDYDKGEVVCNRPLKDQGAKTQYLSMTLQPGEIGGHILFDWNTSKNIDVVNIWKENAPWDTYGDVAPKNALWLGEEGAPPSATTDWRLVSTDVDGDGINGSGMIDGPFKDFSANFNYKPASAGEKLPPYEGEIESTKASFSMGLWPLLAGLFSVFGLRRINNKK